MAKTIQEVSTEVRAVLEKCTCVGRLLTIPPIERKLYQDVNACLEAAGGKWKKGLKAHEFTGPAHIALAAMLTDGKVTDHVKLAKVTRQAFYTPPDVSDTVAMYAQPNGFFVLEPSAGHGALATACMKYGARAVDCIESDASAAQALRSHDDRRVRLLHHGDFLAYDGDNEFSAGYSRIVMNPPFTRGTDAKHVNRARNYWLHPEGLLFAIVLDKGQARADMPPHEVIHKFPKGSFKASGTDVATLLIRCTSPL